MLRQCRVVVSVKFLINSGLYLHIPFCEKKCNYCDFYSSFVTEELLESFTKALKREIKQWGGKYNRPIDTIYFGGGTPSLLAHRLKDVIDTVKEAFCVVEDCEITLEVNPKGDTEYLLDCAKKAGVNRLSIGMQSADDGELQMLGRTHTGDDTRKTVETAKKMGFSNISIDIMIGLPKSDINSLKNSLDFLLELQPQHISSYMLKIEKNTVFYKNAKDISLPSDDCVAEQYLYMCEYLRSKGYSHYEISNFCLQDYESRHNRKYWSGVDYLGIGPSAHSSLNGERFYYKRDLRGFIKGTSPVFDGKSGGLQEYIMLSLRTKEGINKEFLEKIFSIKSTAKLNKKCEILEKAEYLKNVAGNISLTDKGMLVSNAIITEILETII